jgi:hypothetical protein
VKNTQRIPERQHIYVCVCVCMCICVYVSTSTYLPGLAPLEVLLLEAAEDDGNRTGGVLAEELQDLGVCVCVCVCV